MCYDRDCMGIERVEEILASLSRDRAGIERMEEAEARYRSTCLPLASLALSARHPYMAILYRHLPTRRLPYLDTCARPQGGPS